MSTDYSNRAGLPIPSGPSQRRRRISDEETERRMLAAAVGMVASSGLTVGLDHIGFEEIIREAGVSRTAVYRRWPYKDLFFSDLLRALAADARPFAENTEASGEPWRGVLTDRMQELMTEKGRHDLITEMLRVAGESDFRSAAESVEWRTYLALQATFLSLPDGDLRDDIRVALARAEQGFIDRVAGNWKRLADLLGLRLRPGSGADFELIAVMASASLRGLVLMALSDRELPARRVHGNPTGASGPADWSLLGMAAAAIAGAFFEPDPDVVWDEERLAAVRERFGAELGRVTMVDRKDGTAREREA